MSRAAARSRSPLLPPAPRPALRRTRSDDSVRRQRRRNLFQTCRRGLDDPGPAPAGRLQSPAEFASVIAMIERPSIAITDELSVGHNLQMLGVLPRRGPARRLGTKLT